VLGYALAVYANDAIADCRFLQSVTLLSCAVQEDYHLTEKLAQFDRERIPERVVHARGAAAKGFFEVTHDISHLSCADVFRAPGVQVWGLCWQICLWPAT
jgi:catalase